MSILETFYFVFEANASKLDKGLKEADKSSDDLEKRLNATDATAEKLGTNFVKLAKAAGEALAALYALHEVKKLTQETADHTYAVYQQARAIGVSVEALSAWQHAVIASGGTADGAAQSISTLRDKFVEMSRFGGMMGPEAFMFQQLGLSVKDMHDSIKDPMVALSKLAETFGTLDHTQQLFLGKKLGLDIGTITLLSQGRRGLEDMIARQKELGVVTDQQAEAAAKYKLRSAELAMVFENVAREITSTLLPAFTWLLEKVEKSMLFFREHKTFAMAFFVGLAGSITIAYLPAIIEATVATWSFVAAMVAAAAPFLGIAAVVLIAAAAIALIVDDIYGFIEGQNSLIGEAVKKWPILGQIFRAIGEIIQMAGTLIVNVFKSMMQFGTDVALTFTQMRDLIGGAIDHLVKRFPILGDAARLLRDAFLLSLKPVTTMFEILSAIIEKVWGLLKAAPIAILNLIGKGLAKATGGHYDEVGANAAPTPQAAAKAVVKAVTDKAISEVPAASSSAKGAEIAKKLEAMGWTKEQAAGIAGSFLQESGGDNAAVNKTSGAYGLGQWLGSRLKDFKEWSGKDLQGSSLDDQIAFFQYEVTHKEKRAGDMLRAAKTAADAARIHSQYYERPGADEANIPRRQALADAIVAGQSQVSSASSSPVNSISSQTISNSNSSRSGANVTVGPVSVHTQATDGPAVSKAIAEELKNHMKDAIDQYDDGVAG